jgi:hypothetical protein
MMVDEFSPGPLAPNAGGEPRPEAGAQRTLVGVGSSAWLDAFFFAQQCL